MIELKIRITSGTFAKIDVEFDNGVGFDAGLHDKAELLHLAKEFEYWSTELRECAERMKSAQSLAPHYRRTGMSGITRTTELVSTPAMTLREHYAGLAMQGLLSMGPGVQADNEEMARVAVRKAGALIVALQGDEG